ncbi:hypothetical protein, partial [Streptococcus suis]|uniref:hypothetical protein n=1 Tax=Streptococcus suis TaxID=1307 RepID=UPI001EE72CDA
MDLSLRLVDYQDIYVGYVLPIYLIFGTRKFQIAAARVAGCCLFISRNNSETSGVNELLIARGES